MSWDTTKWFLLAFVLLILNWLVRLPDYAFRGLRYLLWVCWTVSVLLLIFSVVCAVGNIGTVGPAAVTKAQLRGCTTPLPSSWFSLENG
jgi:hypothetical protein